MQAALNAAAARVRLDSIPYAIPAFVGLAEATDASGTE
jgi:hypothetical protein